jgi:Bacterial archaeo-eukaryotic release factor family 7
MATRSGNKQALEVTTFRAEEMQRLLAPSQSPCVSIYLPTSRRFPEKRQDPTRYRDLVNQVETLLQGSPAAGDSASMVPMLRALESSPHWEHSLDGFAVFLSSHLSVAYRLPMAVPERAVVADSFHVKPLIRFLRANARYFVLSVSQNAVSLYEGSQFGAGTVDLTTLPPNLREALVIPEYDRAVTAHGGGMGGVAFHGRGAGKEETKDTLLKYFRAIDKGLREFLREERAPLLLASVKYYQPIYREANTYAHLLPEMLEGNYEHVNGDKIHAEAWPIVSAGFERQTAEWVERYRALAGSGLASDDIEAIAMAALSGRVRAVLAAEGETVWGKLDRRTGALTYHDRQIGTEDDDLLDDLCEECLKRGAEVYVVPRAVMPTASPIAAVYRF